jgi:hypothetical protein
LKKRIGRGGTDHYEKNMADDGVIVFPDPIGILDKRGVVDSSPAPR